MLLLSLSRTRAFGASLLLVVAAPAAFAAPAPGARTSTSAPAGVATPDPRFTHREISQLIGHTQVADIDGDGRNDIALHIHRDDFHLGMHKERKLGLAYLRFPDFKAIDIYHGDVAGDRFSIADMNGDGRPDYVAAKIQPDGKNAGYWFENPGPSPAGGPTPMWKEHHAGTIPKGEIKDVLAGDVDNDGKMDIVIRSIESTSLFLQRRDGWKFRSVPHQKREGLALADLDFDGDLDLVLNGFWLETPADAEKGDYVRHDIAARWFNQDSGHWTDNAVAVKVADLNRDGLLDIAFCQSEKVGFPVAWYSVDTPAQVKTGPWKEHIIDPQFDWCETLDIGDLDNDGDLDVLAAKFSRHIGKTGKRGNEPPFPVSVFYNTAGDGSKWERKDLAMDGAYAAMLGDVGSDGDLDIVAPRSYWEGPIRLWENQTSQKPLPLKKWTHIPVDKERPKYGDFAEPKWLRYFGLAMADFTGDGKQDIVSGRHFYRNPGGDLAGKWERVDFGVNTDGCLVLDVDGDEFGDVIAMNLPDIHWLEASDRSGAGWTSRKVATAPRTAHVNSQGFATGQLVPGGKQEIVFATEKGVFYYEIPADLGHASDAAGGASEWPRKLITIDASDEGIDLADIDRDGLVDLIAAEGERYTSWWKNPGDGSENWKRYVIGTTAPRPVDRIRARDMNGDGRPDIVVTEELWPGKEPDANVYWFEQPRDAKAADWKRHRVFTGYSVNNLDVADFDRDGDQDIVTAEHKGTELKLLLFENDGRGVFKEHVLDRGKESHLGTLTADLDGDGDLEIVGIGWDQYKNLHLWRNDGNDAAAK